MSFAQDEVAMMMCLDFGVARLKRDSQLLDSLLIVIEASIHEDPTWTMVAQSLQKMMGRQVPRLEEPRGQLALVMKSYLLVAFPHHVAPRSGLAMEHTVAQLGR
jgi:hypothetical protein